MNARELLDNGYVWHAAQEEENLYSERPTPTAILSRGFSHEFFSSFSTKGSTHGAVFPLLPFIKELMELSQREEERLIVFLGKEVWPTPFCLRDIFSPHLTLKNFLFIDPPTLKNRQRSLEILTQSSQVLSVISFLPKISFAFTQKLYLFSKESEVYTFLFREEKAKHQKSAATSRWEMAPTISATEYPSWKLSLLHSKGASTKEREWLIEGVNEKEVSVHLLSELGSGSRSENSAERRSA